MTAVPAYISGILLFFTCAAANQKSITVESGQNVTLTCRAPNTIVPIVVAEWSRDDLDNKNVFMYRDQLAVSEEQHPSFVDRVDLQDRQMSDGDVSLVLKDVMINDSGTYECRVFQRKTSHERTLLKTVPICIIFLSVVVPPGQPVGTNKDGGKEDGSVGLIAGLSVSALLLVVAVVGFLIYRKCKQQQQSQDSYQPPAEQQIP